MYNPGQVKVIYPFLAQAPDWFILGGPADGNEAQCIAEKYPTCKILACEPDRIMWDGQRRLGFPGTILPVALWDSIGEADMVSYSKLPRSSSLVRGDDYNAGGIATTKVNTTTIDELSKHLGPFDGRVVLWLDIEGAELRALLGAKDTLKHVVLVNVEILLNEKREDSGDALAIDKLLTGLGFRVACTHDVKSGNHYDKVYMR